MAVAPKVDELLPLAPRFQSTVVRGAPAPTMIEEVLPVETVVDKSM
jgi:hypothetical protein